jgi:hypothetical protein
MSTRTFAIYVDGSLLACFRSEMNPQRFIRNAELRGLVFTKYEVRVNSLAMYFHSTNNTRAV